MINISGLKDGYVIDHIKAGKCMEIYAALDLDKCEEEVAIIKNAKSKKQGKKDIIKIAGLIDLNLDLLGFIDDNITVNIIKDERIIEKKPLKLPERICNVAKCKNPRCITSIEQELQQVFVLADAENKIYRCLYCEEAMDRKE
ncbi:MAG: aspartate carbamoyltransferase regulatory subunit [Lachnospiraceae bacterium]|nr:aspartate carbamoyltransferase regulatory subunit [Lachnospiraceae bacterium]